MSYRCCPMIQQLALNVNGRIDKDEPVLSLCCEGLPNIPKMQFCETAEDTLRTFVGMGMLTAVECASVADDRQRHFTAGCAQCANFQMGDFALGAQISYVNLSMYPAPCQSRCVYCGVCREPQTKASEAAYEKLFEILELAERCGILSQDATWQVSSGEIAIHPYRDRIMRLVKEKRAVFYTNCMKYDEAVAQNLHDNPKSAINLSIDAGTPETWKRIKMVDNFEAVLENLMRYHQMSSGPGQITMKYIVLPDVNDVYEDYAALMEILKGLQVKHLTLSRDTRRKYHMSREDHTKLTGAAAYLLAICHKNGISNDMFTYSKEEQEETIKLAVEILQKGLI